MSAKSDDPFDLNAGVPEIQGDIRPKPKAADRISKRVIVVAMVFVVVLVVVFLAALDNMDVKKKPQTDDKKASTVNKEVENNKPPEELTGGPIGKVDAGNKSGAVSLVGSASHPAATNGMNNMAGVPAIPGTPGSIPAGAIPPSTIPPDVAAPKPLTPEQQAAQQEQMDRLARMKQARTTGLTAKGFDAAEGAQGGAKAVAPDLSAVNGLMNAAKSMSPPFGQQPPQAGGEQDEKLDFVKASAKDDRSYHPHMTVPAISQNEVKSGAFIPMILEQGINSDLPGQVTARVSEGVFDTVTGCRLLIPAMTKAVGKYDSKVALGQGRNLVVWNGLVFPDGSELNLAGMQAYSPSGESGMEADVDNHYLRTFGITLGMSLVGAGVQLSVPQPNPSTSGAQQAQTPSQIIAASLAQQYGNLGMQIFSKLLSVQPTLRNSPGERFVVMVPRTIVFTKIWRDRCSAMNN